MAALVNFLIRRFVPSPQTRAAERKIAGLTRELAKLSHPDRKLADLRNRGKLDRTPAEWRGVIWADRWWRGWGPILTGAV